MQKLYDANQEHADEVRAKHVRDIFVDGYWELATRGEKLRTCVAHRPIYTSKQTTRTTKKQQLESVLKDNLSFPKSAKQLQNVNNNIKNLHKIQFLIDEFEQMALEDLNQNWDWKTTILAQVDIVKQQADLTFIEY
jgi:hypothetical protein